MTADALLDLQALDVETRQLNHRREALEQRAKLDEALSEQARRQVELGQFEVGREEAIIQLDGPPVAGDGPLRVLARTVEIAEAPMCPALARTPPPRRTSGDGCCVTTGATGAGCWREPPSSGFRPTSTTWRSRASPGSRRQAACAPC